MNQPLIVLGDTTTHGGAVQSATTGFTANGIAVAGHGDIVHCPAHGIVTIQAPQNGLRGNGKTPAHAGDTTTCGATLIASQRGVSVQP